MIQFALKSIHIWNKKAEPYMGAITKRLRKTVSIQTVHGLHHQRGNIVSDHLRNEPLCVS